MSGILSFQSVLGALFSCNDLRRERRCGALTVLIRLAAVLALCCTVLTPVSALAQLEVRSAILMDLNTGKILYEQNADEAIPPASLTKVLTMLMAFESMAQGETRLDSAVKVSRLAARTGGSRMALKPYESLPLERLLLGMAVSSGNDATAAVAEHLGGSQATFVARMNDKARQIGMSNSVFYNPHGLPAEGQVTTARDMLTLSAYYLRTYPDALRFHSTRYMRHNGVVTYNKNPLLNNYAGADGLKTGWVRASGYNLISTVEQNGTRLLAVILGAENSKVRGRETYRLVEAGFQVARGQGVSVAETIPSLAPAAYAISVDKTAREAYAVLAPETLGKVQPKSRAVQKQKSKKNRKQVEQARKGRDVKVQAQVRKGRDGQARKGREAQARKGKETQAASLSARNG